MTHVNFIQKATQHAVTAKSLGAPINVPVAVAQAALESNFGRSELASRDNNLFGVKGEYKGAFGTWNTREQNPDGSWKTISTKFRKYPNWTECFEDYGAIIGRLPWYQKSAKNHNDVELYLRGLLVEYDASGRVIKPGWATDLRYYDKVMGIIKTHNLLEYEQDLELIQVFLEDKVIEFRPTKVTWGVTNSGKRKLMIKVS